MGGTQVRDEELIRALYAEHARPLLAFAQRLMGGDRTAAEDIVQETLLRAWRNADHLDSGSVRPWLFTTARHLAIDALRTLTPEHRAVLIDSFYRGRTAAEIAVERGMPAGTARSRVYYAMRALRLALHERGVNGP